MASTERDELLSAMPKRPARREVTIGLFTVIGVVAVVVTLLALTDPGMFRGRISVSTVVPDAGGLRKGDPVQMRGVNIGRVQDFAIGEDSVLIHLELERDYPVPEDSRVRLRSSGLLGGMVAEILPGASEDDVESGEMLPGVTQRGLLDPASGVGTRADTVLTRVQELLSRETVSGVGASVSELRVALAELSALVAEQRRQLSGVGTALRGTAENLERATGGPELERAIVRADSVAALLNLTAARLDRAGASLESVIGRMEAGEGTLGRLSADPALYENVNQAAVEFRTAAQNLSALVADIRADPRRYLRVEIF